MTNKKAILLRPPRPSMPPKRNSVPKLRQGEQIIIKGQGGYKIRTQPGWKVAQLFLTDQRFFLYQVSRILFEVALGNIKALSMGRAYYAIKERDFLRVSYGSKDGSGRGEVCFIVNHLEEWKKKIHQLSLLKIDHKVIEKMVSQLDSDGRDMLWYLWENRHAKINQLAELIDAPNHMHVLLIIKETINPVGEKVVGCPILSFERSKLDPETGEKVLFSWWLVGHQDRCVPSEERLLDIFDEGSQIRVIMEVRGVEIGDLKLDFDKDRVTVRCHKIGKSLREKLDLPHEVSPEDYDMHIRNNLLEIKLNKIGEIIFGNGK